jgi:hypothetical protein
MRIRWTENTDGEWRKSWAGLFSARIRQYSLSKTLFDAARLF